MKRWMSLMALACALMPLLPVPAPAQPIAALHSPKPGSAERAAIMDAMRPVIGKGQRKRIVFVARHLTVKNGWAYFSGTAEYADGTHLGPQYVWGNLSALLHYENKTWRVKYHVFHGDVVEPDFMQRYPQAPKAIFQG